MVLLASEPCGAQSTAQAARTPDTSTTASSAPARSIPLQALTPNILSVWAGSSLAAGTLIGNTSQARVGMIALRYHRLLVPDAPTTRTNGPTLTYTIDVFPALFLSIPRETPSVPSETDVGSSESGASLYKQGLDTYGVGVSPAGLRGTFRVATRVQPFVAGSTGLAYFGQSVPNGRGRHLHFMFDVGAGVQVVLTADLILTAGYRYHHLSNGFRGQINPGIDAHLLHFGVAVSQ